MALIQFKDGTRRIVKPDAASRLWLCINGYQKPQTKAQALYMERVYRLYLGPRTKHILDEEIKRRQLKLKLQLTEKAVKA